MLSDNNEKEVDVSLKPEQIQEEGHSGGNEKEVDPAAENVVSTLAKVILGVSIAVFVFALIGSLVQFADSNPEGGWSAILISLVSLASGVIGWAFLRVLVNISRNIFAIREALEKKQGS